ncbi:glycosyl transferase group 1 [mine drainage metagenome]|uniref:Glycosyl transferase group 1 n=1 Tax=mine drainage metagenome TaxID=410659 RepID=T1BKG4_9ZZZZ
MYAEHWAKDHKEIKILALADYSSENRFNVDTVDNLHVERVWSRTMSRNQIVNIIKNKVETFAPDIVHLHYNYFTFGGMMKSHMVLNDILELVSGKNIKSLITLHSVVYKPLSRIITDMLYTHIYTDKFEFMFRGLFNRTLRLTLFKANAVVTPSISAYDYVHKLRINKTYSIFYIPLGYEFSAKIPYVNNLSSSRINISFIGTLSPYKGVDLLIKSFVMINNTKENVDLTIYGNPVTKARKDDKYLRRLYGLVKSNQLEGVCHIEPRFHDYDELMSLIFKSNIIVFPFKDDGILSMSASPYLALNTTSKIVVTDSPRLSDFTGIGEVDIAKSGSVESLTNSILKAIEKLDAVRVTSQSFLQRHDVKTVSEQYYDLLMKLYSFSSPKE